MAENKPQTTASVKLKVNGKEHRVDVLPDTPLLWVLRDNLGMTGTKLDMDTPEDYRKIHERCRP